MFILYFIGYTLLAGIIFLVIMFLIAAVFTLLSKQSEIDSICGLEEMPIGDFEIKVETEYQLNGRRITMQPGFYHTVLNQNNELETYRVFKGDTFPLTTPKQPWYGKGLKK